MDAALELGLPVLVGGLLEGPEVDLEEVLGVDLANLQKLLVKLFTEASVFINLERLHNRLFLLQKHLRKRAFPRTQAST